MTVWSGLNSVRVALFTTASHDLFGQINMRHQCNHVSVSTPSYLLIGMARRTSLLPEQKDFLLSRVPGFREAQKSLSVPAFLAIVYIEWFERWPTIFSEAAASGSGSSSDSSDEREESAAAYKAMTTVSTLFRWCKRNHAHSTLENQELVL